MAASGPGAGTVRLASGLNRISWARSGLGRQPPGDSKLKMARAMPKARCQGQRQGCRPARTALRAGLQGPPVAVPRPVDQLLHCSFASYHQVMGLHLRPASGPQSASWKGPDFRGRLVVPSQPAAPTRHGASRPRGEGEPGAAATFRPLRHIGQCRPTTAFWLIEFDSSPDRLNSRPPRSAHRSPRT